jgi:hypothetical protein
MKITTYYIILDKAYKKKRCQIYMTTISLYDKQKVCTTLPIRCTEDMTMIVSVMRRTITMMPSISGKKQYRLNAWTRRTVASGPHEHWGFMLIYVCCVYHAF